MAESRYGAECPYCHKITVPNDRVVGECEHYAGHTIDGQQVKFRPTPEEVVVWVRKLDEEEAANG